eukprot:m.178405 g.178405  ORF g.178405 m.178405 type:complete len:98 (+) comp14537_c0_seq1:426-719(+)
MLVSKLPNDINTMQYICPCVPTRWPSCVASSDGPAARLMATCPPPSQHRVTTHQGGPYMNTIASLNGAVVDMDTDATDVTLVIRFSVDILIGLLLWL